MSLNVYWLKTVSVEAIKLDNNIDYKNKLTILNYPLQWQNSH